MDKELRMPNRLTVEKREKMYQVFVTTRAESQVMKRCGVHKRTVKRYRLKDNWDERIQAIEQRLQSRTDITIQNRRLRNVKLLDFAIEDIEKQLMTAREAGLAGVIDPKILPRLVATQDLLLGRGAADSENVNMPEEAKQALGILASLGADSIKQLAQLIAHKIANETGTTATTASGLKLDNTVGAFVTDYTGRVRPDNRPKDKRSRVMELKRKR